MTQNMLSYLFFVWVLIYLATNRKRVNMGILFQYLQFSSNFLTFSASLGYIYNPPQFGFKSEDLIVFSSNNSFLAMVIYTIISIVNRYEYLFIFRDSKNRSELLRVFYVCTLSLKIFENSWNFTIKIPLSQFIKEKYN